MWWYLLTYLFVISKTINFFLVLLTLILGTCSLGIIICYVSYINENPRYEVDKIKNEKNIKIIKKIMKWVFSIFFIITILTISIPSNKKDLATIFIVGYALNNGENVYNKLENINDCKTTNDIKEIINLYINNYKKKLINNGNKKVIK